jgi:cysteine-rich repeat protein
MRWTFALVVALAGCLQSSSITCTDGRVCPVGTACATVAAHAACVTDDDLRRCEGLEQGTPCDPLDAGKSCVDGVCINLCGNGHVELSEECDDGNRTAGDNCSAVCLIERCGNGAIDVVLGEECDRGVEGLSGDGCASSCSAELVTWEKLASGLTARAFLATAYDDDAHVVVGFGGLGPDGYLNDTWLWSLEAGPGGIYRWTATTPAHSPPPRTHHSLAYDSVRKRVVLFGGYSPAGLLGDTWEWDGTDWIEMKPATSPPQRRAAQLAYDRVRQVTVLFGGSDANALMSLDANGLDDTWEWNGVNWTERTPATVPLGGRSVNMAYDDARGAIIACINAIADPTPGTQPYLPSQTWRWDGTNWTNLSTCPTGTNVINGMVWDSIAEQILLREYDTAYSTWDGSTWTAGTSIQGNYAPAFFHDGLSQVLFGGHETGDFSDNTRYSSDTIARTLSQWVAQPDANRQPASKTGAIAAFDARHGRALMFGGTVTSGNQLTEPRTWMWSARGWEVMTVAPPPECSNVGITYDSARNVFVRFGGEPTTDCSRTLEHNGTSWSTRNVTEPPGRVAPAMVFDSARGRSLMFGGQNLVGQNQVPRNDFWSWNGVAWEQLQPAQVPPPRSHAAMAYDPVRDRVVLFGGFVGVTVNLADTWEWDGTSWQAMAPEADVAPSARGAAQLVFHPLRQTMLLFGGGTMSNLEVRGDVWEWDGVRWTLLDDDPRMARGGHAAFFDTVRGGVVTFGGFRDETTGASNETWLLAFRSLRPRETCRIATDDLDRDMLAGCADPDCWGRCAPTCAPGTSCPAGAPKCGDDVCDTVVEDYVLCPGDCPPPP